MMNDTQIENIILDRIAASYFFKRVRKKHSEGRGVLWRFFLLSEARQWLWQLNPQTCPDETDIIRVLENIAETGKLKFFGIFHKTRFKKTDDIGFNVEVGTATKENGAYIEHRFYSDIPITQKEHDRRSIFDIEKRVVDIRYELEKRREKTFLSYTEKHKRIQKMIGKAKRRISDISIKWVR